MDTINEGEKIPIPATGKGRAGLFRPQLNPLEKFFPSGAIAFFIVLVALCLIIWFGIYFLMLERI